MQNKIKKVEKNEGKRKEFVPIGLLISILLIIFLILNFISPLLLWDENVYLGNARNHITESNFTEDFRFPLIEYVIAGTWFFTGESIFIARLIIILFTIASVFLLYLISKEYFSKLHSFFLCSLFAFSPLILFWGFRVYTDIPAMFFVTLSFYFLLHGNYKLSGFASALAFLTRFSVGLFPLSVVIYLIIKKDSRALVIFVLFFFIAITPWFGYNQLTYGNPVWDIQEQYLVVAKWTSPEPIIKQIKNLFVFTNLLIPLLLIFGAYSMLKIEKFKKLKLNYLILIYIFISFICYLFFVNLKDERYYLSFLPFIYLVSFRGLLWLGSLKNKKKAFKYVYTCLLILLISSSLLALYYTAVFFSDRNYCETNHTIMQSADYLKNKVGEEDTILSNVWPWFGYHFNVKAACLWDENITMLINIYNPKYIVYNDRIGTGYKKEILDNCEQIKLEKEFIGNCGEKIYVYRVIYD